MANSLITVDYSDSTLASFKSIDALYDYINQSLSKYSDLANLTFKWERGKSLSKMVTEAQDGAGIAKAARAAQFKRIRAIFVNEGINDLIEAVYRKLGAKSQFAGVTKTGIGNFKFVPPTLANGKQDAVLKVAESMAAEVKSTKTNEQIKALGYDILEDGSIVKRTE
jgi:hypothetical protein